MNYLVKCKFCPKLNLEFCNKISEFSSGLVPRKRPCDMYCCLACKSNFFYEGERLVGYSFKSQYKKEALLLYWFEENGYTELTMNYKFVTKFNGGTSLTPHNIAQRMPTILTFL